MIKSKCLITGPETALLLLILSCYGCASESLTCRYGDRGSLTAICTNANELTDWLRDTSYRFDHLDETLLCLNCTLSKIGWGTFDLGGNKIRTLNLTNSNINTIEQSAFIGLIYLEQLILSNNRISNMEVGTFYGIKKVNKIYLENALVAPLKSLVFKELWHLKELYLKNNFLTKLENKTFYGLTNLEILDLSYNKLRELNESMIYLRNLKVLILNNNEIVKIGYNDFSGLQSMLDLNLANNLIGSINFTLTEPNSLKQLNLSNNHLGNTVVKIGTFEHMHDLEILDLSLNWFKVIPPKLLRGLFNLRQLILSNNTISHFASGAFSGIPSLRIINLSHNNIEKADITGRLLMSQLHAIDLSDNKIVDFSFVKFLQKTPRISKIDLSSNLLSCKKRRQIEHYFKNENIQYIIDTKSCPELSQEEMDQIYKDIYNEIDTLNTKNPAITTLKILFIVILICLVGLLFFIHFYILDKREY